MKLLAILFLKQELGNYQHKGKTIAIATRNDISYYLTGSAIDITDNRSNFSSFPDLIPQSSQNA